MTSFWRNNVAIYFIFILSYQPTMTSRTCLSTRGLLASVMDFLGCLSFTHGVLGVPGSSVISCSSNRAAESFAGESGTLTSHLSPCWPWHESEKELKLFIIRSCHGNIGGPLCGESTIDYQPKSQKFGAWVMSLLSTWVILYIAMFQLVELYNVDGHITCTSTKMIITNKYSDKLDFF